MPVSGQGQGSQSQTSTTPNKVGWHLVTFQNGDVAVVRWNGHDFVWGSLHAPASPITGLVWLGSSVSSFDWANWASAVGSLPGVVSATLIGLVDHGILNNGQPVLVNNQGKLAGGTSGQTHSEAVPQNLGFGNVNIPNPLNALGGVLSGWADLLVRVLEALVGVALLFLGLQALTGTGGQGQPIKTVKRYA